jgi:HEAT repeat protein
MPLKKISAQEPPEANGEVCMTAEAAAIGLTSSDPNVRQSSARRLTGAKSAAMALCDCFIAEADRAARETLAIAIMRTGGSAAVEKLLPLLSSEDPTLRNSVIEILQALPADVAPHMEALLDHPDSDVRIFVVNVLEALRHPKVEDWLIAVISTDAHANVVGTALDLLGEVGTEAAMPALSKVMRRFSNEPFLRFAAENAIKRIGAGH